MSNRKFGLFQTQVAGIPCQIDVTTCTVVKGNSRADNDWDYYGYTEFEFDVYDRKGYPAKWLERKLTPADRSRIEKEYLSDCED
jgi:hypothetical protein